MLCVVLVVTHRQNLVRGHKTAVTLERKKHVRKIIYKHDISHIMFNFFNNVRSAGVHSLKASLSGFPGAIGGVSAGSDACLLPRRSDLHPSEDSQRDQRGPGPLDIWEAAGGAGKQEEG